MAVMPEAAPASAEVNPRRSRRIAQVLRSARRPAGGARCIAYLMGNHVIAERMYRRDPAVMLHVQPGTAIYADNVGWARFVTRPAGTASSIWAGEISTGAGP